ncbi:hypothetical protein BDR22DRAFT_80990 [Usnea florida]
MGSAHTPQNQFIADVSFEKNDDLYAAMHWIGRLGRSAVVLGDMLFVSAVARKSNQVGKWRTQVYLAARRKSFGIARAEVSLQILRSSKQTYSDGNRISIAVQYLLLQRRGDIRTLRGHAKPGPKAHAGIRSLLHKWEWNTALKAATVRSLQGLRQLRQHRMGHSVGGLPFNEARPSLPELH